MNSNWRLRTQGDGVRYILSMVEKHGDLAGRIWGMHFHQSLSGSYCRANVGKTPADFPLDYYQEFARNYSHILQVDLHRPWTDPDCVQILDRVQPKYLTHELRSGPRRSQVSAVRRQLCTIRSGRESAKGTP